MALFSPKTFPALKASALLATGILAGDLVGGDIVSLAAGTAILIAVLIMLICKRRDSSLPAYLSTGLLCIAVGNTGYVFHHRGSLSLPDPIQGREVVLTGTLLEAPHAGRTQTRFLIENSHILMPSRMSLPGFILVSIRTKEVPSALGYGMTMGLRGVLSRPAPERNPGEFNQRTYYEANGVRWMLSVAPGGITILDSAGGSWLMRNVVMPARNFMILTVDSFIGEEEGEFLKGVMIGERGGLTPEMREAFTVAGVAHVLAVSGGNVAVIAAFVFYLMEILRTPARLRLVMACVAVIFYMMLVGPQPPVVRATIMALVLLVGKFFDERPNPLNALGVSALVILGLDAGHLFDVGFQLSFLAVLSIIYLYPIVNTWSARFLENHRWRPIAAPVLGVCAVSFVATIGTLPLTAVYFGQVSVVGILANIVVVPASALSLILGFVSVPIALVSPFVAEIYAELNRLVLGFTIGVARTAAGLPFASIDTSRFAVADALPYYALMLFLFHLGDGRQARKLFLTLLVSLAVWIHIPPSPQDASTAGRLRVSFVDVGQGDAALVEFPNAKSMLIDAGPRSVSFDAGKKVVVPFLKRRGISVLDCVVVTHPHSDHLGGLPAVLEEFEVREVIHCGREIESDLLRITTAAVLTEQCRSRALASGELLGMSPDCRVYILSPPSLASEEILPGVNNASVVLKIVHGEAAILFTGDAEEEAEQLMVLAYGDFLNATLLKSGHHGSRTSNTAEFVSAVRPAYAVISVGEYNRYGHPSDDTIRRFNEHGVTVFRTDEEGAVIFESDGKRMWRVDWREEQGQ